MLNSVLRRPVNPARSILYQILWLISLLLSLSLQGAEAGTYRFDIPAGNADQALKSFSEQSGHGMIVSSEVVKSVKTNAVRGEFAAATALDQMLSGTGLIAVPDSASGAFTVRRASDPNGPRAVPETDHDRPGQKQATPNEPQKSNEETLVLSPFTIAAERDSGFVAASSLAGGRFTTELKDTAAAYSVLTRDFLDALNLVDTEDALTWAVGTDKLKDSGSDKIFYTDAGSNVRSRGVHVRGVQRNFFLLGLSSDTYSQERIDFARSPSALLVGNSGLGGSIISLTKRARTDRSFTGTNVTVGSYGEKRATLDTNRALTANFALRGNFLWQDSNDWRDEVFDRRKGAHLTATFRPLKHTEIRAEWETYRNESLQTLSSPLDRVSGWDGTTVVNNGPAATVPNSTAAGISRLGSSTAEYIVFVPALAGGRVLNYANTWATRGGGEAAGVAVGGVTPLSTTNLNVAGASITDDTGLPATRFDLAQAHSGFVRPGREFVISPDAPTAIYDFRDSAVFIEQQIGEHVFLELAANQADTLRKTEYIVTRGINDARIDVNRLLPTGETNPFFLEPYGEAANGHTYFRNEIFDYRAAVAAVFDGTRWGSFRANVIGGNRRNKQFISQFTDVLDRSADVRERPFNDLVTYRYYWNAPHPFYRPQSIDYVNPVAGTTGRYNVVDMVDLRNPGNNRTADTEFTYLQGALNAKLLNGRLNLLGGIRHDRLQVESRSVTTQPRRDYPSDWDGQAIYYLPAAPADYFNLTYVQKDANGAPSGAPQPALTRPRDAAGNPLPQYASDRFRSDYSAPKIDQTVTTATYGGVLHVLPWLSGFYNFAETFNPSVVGQTVTGELLPAQLSEGWDAGLRFTFLGGRFSATATAYNSTQANNAFDASSVAGTLQAIVEANPKNDQSPTGRNTRGLGPIPSPYFDFQDLDAKGYEFEVVANLTREWRLMLNYARPKVSNTHRYSDTFAYLGSNEPTLRQIVLDSGGLIDAGGVATIDPSVPVAQQSPDVAAAVAAWNSLQGFKVTNALSNVTPNATHDYMWNVFTDYRFQRGRLKGLKVGGGAQYRGKKSIGNRSLDTIVDPANRANAIDDPTVDSSTNVYMSGYYTVTAVLGYEYRLPHNMTLNLDLRISNLLDEDRLIYVGTTRRPPNGDLSSPARVTVPSSYYLMEPRTFSLTASLHF